MWRYVNSVQHRTDTIAFFLVWNTRRGGVIPAAYYVASQGWSCPSAVPRHRAAIWSLDESSLGSGAVSVWSTWWLSTGLLHDAGKLRPDQANGTAT